MIDTAAAVVDMDSQRIMAVSIGKIQASRGQRGGPTLRKSLLISTILHKARSSMMMENFQAMMDSQRSQEVPQSEAYSETSEDSSQMAPIPLPVACSAWSTGPPEPEEDYSEDSDKENPGPVYTALTTVASPPSSPLDVLREKDANSDPSYDPTCARCTKRRFSDAQPQYCDVTDPSLDSENNNMCKRQRLESEEQEYDQSCQYSSQEFSSCMQTDSQNPISSLVSRFNSGLSGFLGANMTNCENESCASTVSKDLGVMSRTCIALAV